ncbi:FAD-dependent oxidoreductase [Longispora albida]|uniref:FAD-dependent oxidoreductase n=1 Tax=Longispora albida TaxID=203523 RepID=UPI0003AB364E|nr:FAD-dependent oxidoreductase [Longispora albida]
MPSKPRPAVIIVDGDVVSREDVVEGLRERYAGRYRVIGASTSGETAAITAQLPAVGSPIALVVAQQHLGDGLGTELLSRIQLDHPSAKRVLLCSAADAETAIDAINRIYLDRYLISPCVPAEERLYPALDDLLFDWESNNKAAALGVRVLGERFAARSYEIKDFLARNVIPFEWLDLADAGPRRIAQELGLPEPYPTTVLLSDGRALYGPSLAELALELGLTQPATSDSYDLIIAGGGPAGLAAAVYGACEGFRVLIIEDDAPGGQAGTTSKIENYLGFPSGLSGADLAQRALAQAKRFGVEWLCTKVATGLREEHGMRYVTLDDGTELSARVVLVATGMSYRRLDAPGVADLLNAGVYYGASLTEAIQTEGEDVYILGSGNSAGQAALYFAEHARSVTMLIRETSIKDSATSAYLVERLEAHERVILREHTELAEAHGSGRLDKLTLRDNQTGETELVSATSLYILIGTTPCSGWVAGQVGLDEFGFILTGSDVTGRADRLPAPWPEDREPMLMETSMPGVFAAGDVRAGSVKRVGSAVGQGAVAMQAITQYLRERVLPTR